MVSRGAAEQRVWTLLSIRVKEERTGRGGGGDPPSFRQDCTDLIIHLTIPAVCKERNHPQPDYLLAWTDHTLEATVLQRLPFNSNSLVGVLLPPALAVQVAYL